MSEDLIQIEERMYTAPEVARIIQHDLAYVHALLEKGKLQGLRPDSPSGRQGQWRVYPVSLRHFLGLHTARQRSCRTIQRKIEAELREARARFGLG